MLNIWLQKQLKWSDKSESVHNQLTEHKPCRSTERRKKEEKKKEIGNQSFNKTTKKSERFISVQLNLSFLCPVAMKTFTQPQ